MNVTNAPFTKLVVFGDGLSDQGRFGKLTDNRYPPSPPFYEGRWTNGPTWVEIMAQQTGIPLRAADNYAQGGATTGVYNINEPTRQALGLPAEAPIRGVLAQVDAFLQETSTPDAQALYIVWAGGHDFGSYLDYGQPDLRAYPPADNIRQAVERLAAAGAKHFFIGNMPDISNTPQYFGTAKGQEAAELVRVYNEALHQLSVRLRETMGIRIELFDAAAIFTEIAMNAETFGIKIITEAFLPFDYIDFTNPLAPAKPLPASREGQSADDYMSFWAVAAGRKVHALLGERAAQQIMRAKYINT
jgi:phospholipase/lecithinase/hemolysin